MPTKRRHRHTYARTAALAGAVAAAALLAAPASGHAATTIGSDLSAAPNGSISCVTAFNTCPSMISQDQLPGRTVRAPAAGVVVRWRVRGAGGELAFRVLDEGGDDDTVTGAGTDAETFPSPADPGVRTVETRMPIGAGDRIGVNLRDGTGNTVGVRSPAAGAVYDFWDPAPADGESRAATSPDGSGIEYLLNADIEPDQDRDAFGDETQDVCPASADHGDSDNDGRPDACDPFPRLAGNPQPGACANRHTGGTPGPDTLTGTGFGDLIRGQGGNDVISGLGGADCLFGEAGNDRLAGGSSRDRLSGGTGRDRLSGGSGNDRLSGGAGNDVLRPGPGRDRVSCGRGRDQVRGAGRRDRLIGC